MILRMKRAPLAAVLIASSWLAGAWSGSYLVTAAAIILGLVLPALAAVGRRGPKAARHLAVGLSTIAAMLVLVLLVLRPGGLSGPRALEIELLLLAVGSLTVPLLYAATFGANGSTRR